MTYNENTLQDLAQNIYSLINRIKTIVPIHDFVESVWSDKHIEILREQIAIVKNTQINIKLVWVFVNR